MLSGAPQRLYESVKKEIFPLSVVLSKRTLKMLVNKGVFVDDQGVCNNLIDLWILFEVNPVCLTSVLCRGLVIKHNLKRVQLVLEDQVFMMEATLLTKIFLVTYLLSWSTSALAQGGEFIFRYESYLRF